MNKHCVLLSCGPSLNQVSDDWLRWYAHDKVVYAVKLAYYKVPTLVDTLFINCCNNPAPSTVGAPFYSFTERSQPPTVVASSNFPKFVRLKNQPVDYFFRVPNTSIDQHEVVGITRNFDKFLFDKDSLHNHPMRPVGPGIMLETVLYWVVLNKFTQLTTIGFDLSEKAIDKQTYKHFWDNNAAMGDVKFTIPGYVLPTDAKIVVEASESIYNWLASHGIRWNVVDPNDDCALWEGIPRVDL